TLVGLHIFMICPVLDPSAVFVRGPGDGMETDKPMLKPEMSVEPLPLKVSPARQSPRTAPASPGVLHLGKVNRESCAEVEAVRIVVPRAAIIRSARAGAHADSKTDERGSGSPHHSEDRPPSPPSEPQDYKSVVEKLQNSERRLLQDKDGLSNQLRVQTESNAAFLSHSFHLQKNQLILENEVLGRNLAHTAEQLERMSIQCDVWRSKFLASRVMAEELTNSRAALQRQIREAQTAIQDLLREREEFSRDMTYTHRSLEQLLVSLQWGRQQTYYPSAQPLSTGELAAANHKLADAINSHLLGNTGKSSSTSVKSSSASELCNTPAEKMAEKVLRILDPISCPDSAGDSANPDSTVSPFLPNKKSIGRFHPYTRYENITFNCCEHCSGELLVL
ncbi:hypothetical protein QTP86_017738, partial [Hemibagrus guttatus]